MNKTGKIYSLLTPYYDIHANQMAMKKRPALIIGKADNEDYVVLPLSTITKQNKRDIYFDLEVTPVNYPLLQLSRTSYIRTHKQQTVHNSQIYTEIANLKQLYPDLFREILAKVKEFQQKIQDEAL